MALGLLSCEKDGKDFLDTEPASGTLTDAQARELQGNPISAAKFASGSLVGIYQYMKTFGTWTTNHDDFGQKAVDLGLESMTEDLVHSSSHWFDFDYQVDNREANYRRPTFVWNFYYKIILFANSIIEKTDPNSTDAAVRGNLGQALALRAYAYHYLVQLYANRYIGNQNAKAVPIYTTTTDITGKPRATVQQVYDLILADLGKSVTLLGITRQSKEFINRNVANGILARVYMSMGNWAEAEKAANAARSGLTLINATTTAGAAAYTDGFSFLGNQEWMWGGEITSQTTSIFASFFSMMDNVSPGYAGALNVFKLIGKKLYDQMPATDIRKTMYKDPTGTIKLSVPATISTTRYPAYSQFKFIDANNFTGEGRFTGDYVYMRVPEMYLIEAEAQARQGKNAAAQQTLFELVSRRDPAYVKSTKTGEDLVEEIFTQKRIELWGEGFTFLDLKRMNRGIDRTGSNHRLDATLVIPGGDRRFTYKIPQRELEANPAIPASDQNP